MSSAMREELLQIAEELEVVASYTATDKEKIKGVIKHLCALAERAPACEFVTATTEAIRVVVADPPSQPDRRSLREMLIEAAALAVGTERRGMYQGAAWVADAVLAAAPAGEGVRDAYAPPEALTTFTLRIDESWQAVGTWPVDWQRALSPGKYKCIVLAAAPEVPRG